MITFIIGLLRILIPELFGELIRTFFDHLMRAWRHVKTRGRNDYK